ncbi:glutamate--tRNA ligase [Sphingobium nicotianae]|uniref:Glutamate--tRNA ligase n=1 Tax=Sphingobium nicotianae TaxID=2782607 RepID=A0A9X1DBM4_9SPHN|nr:glutamate--tRNA ligase [Sphingobium nicotianae]
MSDATKTTDKVVTRFAPSPTGYLHIGGARTALFNYLFARHHGGKFLLRIEDTDRARSTEPAIAAIFDGLAWLGLAGDEEPVFQFARAARHAEVANQMLAAGHAYKCFATQEELAELREQQRAAKQPMRYDGRWRDRDAAEGGDKPFVIRLKAPREGETVIEDAVQGRVVVQNAELDDMILLRSDGTPTYMLAVVVDDHDMGVTHVIRGDDHLNNAFRQLGIIKAMGWPEPVYAHIPLIHGPDGAKLSKRHGAMGVDAYRDKLGMLPEAVDNYLLRLGWGHGDEEIISTERAIELFDLPGVGRSPSRFDIKKLESINAHYIREADPARLAALVAERMPPLGDNAAAERLHRLIAIMPELQPRAKTVIELLEGAAFLFVARPIPVDEAAAKLLDDNARTLLKTVADRLRALPEWTLEEIETVVRTVAEDAGLGLGKVAQPLRAALTGRTTSPGIFDVLLHLGREETLGRLDDQAQA